MLEPLPSRGVARFLVPLTDIMAVLFSFFLLLPHLEQQGPASMPPAGEVRTAEDERRTRAELERLRRQQRLPAGERLTIVVLDVDGATGDLLLHEGDGAVRITEANVDAVITRHLGLAQRGERELFYLLRAPRPGQEGIMPHPLVSDELRYRQWFGRHKVDYRIDYPRLAE
jgi:hypothetical protein